MMFEKLAGRWEGIGTASYPTIETAVYREVLTFQKHDGKPILQVEQKTWHQHQDKSETLLHWEFGFIRQLDDENYEWNNTQNNGRVEVLRGHLTSSPVGLSFQSYAYANDPRMVSATRKLTLEENRLHYQLQMATSNIAELQAHLEMTLTKI